MAYIQTSMMSQSRGNNSIKKRCIHSTKVFSDAHMNGKCICKMEAGMYIVLRILQPFSILVIKITYFKFTGKQFSVITVPCFRMRLL